MILHQNPRRLTIFRACINMPHPNPHLTHLLLLQTNKSIQHILKRKKQNKHTLLRKYPLRSPSRLMPPQINQVPPPRNKNIHHLRSKNIQPIILPNPHLLLLLLLRRNMSLPSIQSQNRLTPRQSNQAPPLRSRNTHLILPSPLLVLRRNMNLPSIQSQNRLMLHLNPPFNPLKSQNIHRNQCIQSIPSKSTPLHPPNPPFHSPRRRYIHRNQYILNPFLPGLKNLHPNYHHIQNIQNIPW